MVAERFAADGDAMLDHFGGFAQGQRVALDVVGVVVPLQAQLFPQARLVLRRERLESLPFIPQGVEGLKLVMHGAGKPEMETRATGKR